VHNVDSFIREFVGLDDALVAHHLDDESTLCLVLPLLHANFTAIDCAVAPQWVIQTAFEDGQECFCVHAAGKAAVRSAMGWHALVVGEKLPAI